MKLAYEPAYTSLPGMRHKDPEFVNEPPLMPRDADEKWYVRAVSQIVGSAYGLDDARVNGDWYRHWIAEGFAGLEGFLAAQKRCGSYSLGERVSMADVCLVPQVFKAQRFGCDLKPYPTVMGIFERCMALSPFVDTQPSKHGDAT